MNTNLSPKLFVGPMSKTVVDACIEYANDTKTPLGLIPSRRQVDMFTGYVNNWRTDTLASYVRKRTDLIVLQRDHGGPSQGDMDDDGLKSLEYDATHFDLLHIDPFKKYNTFDSAINYTADVINNISKFSQCQYEIGTEEAIFPLSITNADMFFTAVKRKTGDNFDRVKYLVVQFGTKIIGTHNTGQFDRDRAEQMVNLCGIFGKLSKEHNGDYLTAEGVKTRRGLGLDALNIAPEMGGIETECIIDEMQGNQDLIDAFFDCCIATNRWQKWFPANFNPSENKLDVLRACGHYCFSTAQFKALAERMNYDRITETAKGKIKERIAELL
jgi:hypothetical protein